MFYHITFSIFSDFSLSKPIVFRFKGSFESYADCEVFAVHLANCLTAGFAVPVNYVIRKART